MDELVLAKGLGKDLKHSQALILSGQIVVDDQRVDKVAKTFSSSAEVRIKGEKKRFASRAGDKLFGALNDLGLTDYIAGKTVLDIGSSTGGFTDCCLKLDAEMVLCVDVGTNQLDWSLRNHEKIQVHEQTDIRNFQTSLRLDLIVADLSFISLAGLAEPITALSQRAPLLLLIKPQFELPKHEVGEGGVVTDLSLREKAVERVSKAFRDYAYGTIATIDSKLAGKKGNVEIFIYLEAI